jgi:hypothetical protein
MSVIERLASLPDVFDLGLFCLTTGLHRNSAKVMVSRWAAKGYLDLAGSKSGVYFKRLAASLDQSEQTAAAVQLLYPSATVCGASVLHRCARTTQVPRELHVAIEARPSVTSLNGVVLHQRSLDWFRTIAQHQGFEAAPRRRSPWRTCTRHRTVGSQMTTTYICRRTASRWTLRCRHWCVLKRGVSADGRSKDRRGDWPHAQK